MEKAKTLLFEDNIISLRTAIVLDDGDTAYFQLQPAWMSSSIPGAKPRGCDWALQDSTWLYRHKRSWLEERELKRICPGVVQQKLKPMEFEKPPEFKLAWTDTGNGVALFLNGEVWAFIDEETHRGYSKGILKDPDMSPWRNSKNPPPHPPSQWNQELYEKIFGAK